MKKLLSLAAVSEAATGLVLFAYPPIVVHLLFGADIAGAGIILSRIAGISLIALGIACWPPNATLFGMLTYSTIAALYLTHLGISGVAGILLWPAVAVHALLSVLLLRAWRIESKHPSTRT